MDRLNIQYYYGLGASFSRLVGAAESTEPLSGQAWSASLASAIDWAKSFAGDDTTPLPKTKKAASVLLEALNNFSKLLGQSRETTIAESLSVSNAVSTFYHVFEQESEDVICYVVRPVGAYAVSALIENASSHLSSGAQKVVSDGLSMISTRLGNA
jgi:hypothetical protein